MDRFAGRRVLTPRERKIVRDAVAKVEKEQRQLAKLMELPTGRETTAQLKAQLNGKKERKPRKRRH